MTNKVSIKRLDSITKNDTTATEQINSNFLALQEAIENTLSRDGTSPNFMDADLDMNSYRIINSADPVEDNDIVNLKYVEERIGGAVEASKTAVSAASQAASSAQSALVSSTNAINTLRNAEEQLNNVIQYVDESIQTIDNTIAEAVEDVKQQALDAAQESIDTAAEQATTIVIDYANNEVKPQLNEIASNAAESAENASESAGLAANESGNAAISATDAQHYAEDSRIWAEGSDSEVQALGGVHSSKVWSEIVEGAITTIEGAITTIEGAIGDIGFAPLGIDESQNKRRYLNGQVISQAQFESFTKKIKEAVTVNSSLVATEENWQAEVTNSVLGQCGKFVIDDTLGTIRLPKVVNINGLQDLALMGSIKAESLPNLKSNSNDIMVTNTATGLIQYNANWSGTIDTKYTFYVGDFDASRSSSTYQDNAPVQQEAIQYPYFIQVATGVEESVDVTREIELNNPFSLLDYKWSEYELSNASWLLSNGAFHSGTVYKSVYELLLKIHNGTETKEGVSVKLSTESFDDTDFVLNTADTTFRLPVKVKLASGNAVVGNGMTLGLTEGTHNVGLYHDTTSGVIARQDRYGTDVGSSADTTATLDAYKSVGITTDPLKSGIETSSSGLKLYFYVGETIQDANVIAASGVLTKVANSIDRTSATDRETVVGWGMPDYSAGVNITSLPYIAPVDGLISILGQINNTTAVLKLNDEPMLLIDAATNIVAVRDIKVKKGDVLDKLYVAGTVPYNNTDRNEYSMFYPLKGVN